MKYFRKNRYIVVATFILVLSCFLLGFSWGKETCPQCNGTGKIPAICGACNGKGHKVGGASKCEGCGGDGAVSIQCPTCKGSGQVPKKK